MGLELEVVDLGFRNCQRKGFGVLLELKEKVVWWFIWRLFGRKKKLWVITVLIGKRNALIWGCKEEEKERILWCSRVVWTIPQQREEEKKEEKGRKKKSPTYLNTKYP